MTVSEKICAAEEFIRGYVEKEDISGYARVTLGGKEIFARGFGYADREKKIPVDADTVFSLYSLSKPFCALALMTLWDRGLIDLDAHPGKYIPEAAGLDARMTLRQILTHTSGVPDFVEDGIIKDDKGQTPISPAEMRRGIASLSSYPQAFVPGTAERYCNVNFNLCALTVENAAGVPYEEYMKKNVFLPLGMKTARVDAPGLDVPHRAVGYGKKNGAVTAVLPVYQWMFGAGDLIGTAADVYALGEAITQKKLLSAAAWREVLTPSPINHMGFGCAVYPWRGRTRIRHNGGYTGFRTFHTMIPAEGLDFVFLFNQDFVDPRETFTEKFYDIFGDPEKAPLLSGVAEFVPEPDKGYADRGEGK